MRSRIFFEVREGLNMAINIACGNCVMFIVLCNVLFS